MNFLPSLKSCDTKTPIENPAQKNSDIVLQFKNQQSFVSCHCTTAPRVLNISSSVYSA